MSDCPSGSRWREALALIGRRPAVWIAAVVAGGLAWGIVLLAAIVVWSLRPLVERSAIGPEATVILASGAGAAEAEALRTTLSLLPAVAAARFVPRDAALARIASRTPADREAIGQLAANPLPDVVVASFAVDASPAVIESTVAAIRKLSHVDGVEVDLGWYRKLWAAGRIGVVGLLAIACLLLVHAAGWLIVGVALSGPIDARRVQLLWMLGADDRAVRRGPVVAAALTALAMAAIAVASARAGWQWLDREMDSLGRLYGGSPGLQWPQPDWIGGFVAAVVVAALLIGSVRARLWLRAVRKYLARS